MAAKHTYSFTPEAKRTMQYAGVLTDFEDKKLITSWSLFWAVFALVRSYSFAPVLWSLLGAKDYAAMEEYFDAHFKDVSFSALEGSYKISGTLTRSIHSHTGQEQAVDFLHLLHASLSNPTQRIHKEFAKMDIQVNTIHKNCQYILHHPMLSQLGLFAFLETLSTLVDTLPLAPQDLDLMHIELLNQPTNAQPSEVVESEESNPNQSKTTSDSESKKMTIEYFAIDLVGEATNNDLDPVIGRDAEIDQMIYTLLRKTKNNPLLLGEAGVGKTAVVEGLSQRIASGDVPDKLSKMRVMMLDMTSVVAGTKYRGEFESRMKSILEEATDPTNRIILFIDEIHTIIGAGGQDNGDAAQMIKPLLARGKIKLIGATTFDEYQKYIEKDAALKRRFQEVTINEPDYETTKHILEGIKETYEDYHGIALTDEAITSSITLSTRYMLNKHLPDKAIDLIDEASAKVSTLTRKLENNDEYKQLEQDIDKMDKKIEKAIAKQDYFDAAELKKQQETLKEELLQVRKTVSLPHHLRPEVDEHAIADVLSSKTGIPSSFVQESELHKLKRLQSDLEKHVLGQPQATDAVMKTLIRSRLSAVEHNKPIASFLFLGPSGTGKTHMAKTIARDYFGDEKAMIRVDMSEFMESYSVSKLIGSAPGYVGHEQGGMLTEQVKRKPYSVILFDEIEKASRDVLNILLQVLDEGHLKDSKGRRVDFKSTIIVMTSNVGSSEFTQKISQIGFAGGDDKTIQASIERKKERVMERLKSYLSPEFLNRLDHTIVFHPLSKPLLAQIFKTQYADFSSHRSTREDVSVPTLSDARVDEIIEDIYDPELGARPIHRYIHQTIESEMIEKIMKDSD